MDAQCAVVRENGLKSGAGFYDYRGRDVMAYRKDVMARMLAMLRQVGMARPPAG